MKPAVILLLAFVLFTCTSCADSEGKNPADVCRDFADLFCAVFLECANDAGVTSTDQDQTDCVDSFSSAASCNSTKEVGSGYSDCEAAITSFDCTVLDFSTLDSLYTSMQTSIPSACVGVFLQ